MHPSLSPSPQPTASQAAEPPGAVRPAARETLLVVDDGSAQQAAAVSALEAMGYRVVRAGNAQAALALLQDGTPVDLLMADEAMPRGMPSPELAQCARQLHPGIALLITSDDLEGGASHDAMRTAGVELVAKPYLPDQLARSLRHLLANQQQVNALANALREARRLKAAQAARTRAS